VLIPLGDQPNFDTRRPWVNHALIAVNVAVYLGALIWTEGDAGYQAWIAQWGFVPIAPRFETFFTSMFMHAGALHLAGNMLFLWVFGDNVEGRLGHFGYLCAYLAFGLAAVLLFRTLDPGSTVPLVGASGAIFGVEGFYFVAFARNRVKVLTWFFFVYVLWVPARLVLGVSFLLNLLYMLTPQGEQAGGGVAYAAHVGGFVFGAVLALALRPFTPREADVPVTAAGTDPGALVRHGVESLRDGRLREAKAAFERALAADPHGPSAPEAALNLGMLLARAGASPRDALRRLSYAASTHPDPAARAMAEDEIARLARL
jgi:membrane associated rhomboid family serine protease